MAVRFCEACGGPIDAPWREIVLVCPACGTQNAPGPLRATVPSSTPNDGRPRLNVAGRTYVLEGRLALGDSSDVFRARWVQRLGELVVVKVQRAMADTDLLRREYAFLERLRDSPHRGAAHFQQLLPGPIAVQMVPIRGRERLVSVYEWRSGLTTSLSQARDTHDGVPGQVLVWVAKRVLEVLAFAHAEGVAHGSILPPHVLVHPTEHAAMLVGWTTAGVLGSPLVGQSTSWKGAYEGIEHASVKSDLRMLAWTLLWAAEAKSRTQTGTLHPDVVGRLVEAVNGEVTDAWTLRRSLDAVALRAYGPPAYNPLGR